VVHLHRQAILAPADLLRRPSLQLDGAKNLHDRA
jgi:hypothetical protein